MIVRRGVILDFDGVLRHWNTVAQQESEARSGLPPGAIAATMFAPALLHDVITGSITHATWLSRVRDSLAERYPEVPAGPALDRYLAIPPALDRHMVELVAALRTRANIVLLSNSTDRLRPDLAGLGLSEAFDAVVSSSDIACAKPEPGAFLAAAQAIGVAPHRCFVVDDSPANVAAAVEIGMAGMVFTDAAAVGAAIGNWLDAPLSS